MEHGERQRHDHLWKTGAVAGAAHVPLHDPRAGAPDAGGRGGGGGGAGTSSVAAAVRMFSAMGNEFPWRVSSMTIKSALVGLAASLMLIATEVYAADPAIPDSVIWETGLEYSNPDDSHLQLNLARPKAGDGPFPVALCIHGGGFRAGKRESYDGMCVKLAERGYVAATITYRLAPQYRFPAAVHDTKAAVRWLRAN